MRPDQVDSPEQEARMDLPRPMSSQEKGAHPEQPPILKQGTEVNPEFLPPVGGAPHGVVTHAPPQITQSTSTVSAPQASQGSIRHSTTSTTTPDLAEDVDLIEKEWVDKAKAIVAHTKDDPHRQNKEINKMKADYIKKRYNRDIQVGE